MPFSRRSFLGKSAAVTAATAIAKPALLPSKGKIQKMTLPVIATPLCASGRWIVDANGNRVKLAGVNWVGAHEDAMVSGGLDFLHRDAIAAQIASWGFNHVRLTFAANTVLSSSVIDPSTVTANPDLVGVTPWVAYQAVTKALTNAGIMVIPNMQLMYQGWCCGPDTNGLWWNANWTYDTYQSVWETVVNAFAGNPLVIGYDLKNEPRTSVINGVSYTPTWGSGTTGKTGTDFQWFYNALGAALISTDSTKLMIMEGINTSSGLNTAKSHPISSVPTNKRVFSAHDYPQAYAASLAYNDYATTWQDQSAFLMTEGYAPLWIGEFGLANDSMSALGGSNPVSHGNGLGAGPVSQGYGNWWNNFVRFWGPQGLDADWCTWHLSGTHVKGTQPSTNLLMYNRGDRTWNGLYAQDWQGPANPAHIAALQSIMPAAQGPGIS